MTIQELIQRLKDSTDVPFCAEVHAQSNIWTGEIQLYHTPNKSTLIIIATLDGGYKL